MEIDSEIKVLRIFISSTDKFKHMLVSEALVFAARRYGMSGATVLRGIMGYGSSSVVHSMKFWEITEKLPVVIEIIDNTEKIDYFIGKIIPWFKKLRYGCLITTESAHIVLYKQGNKSKLFNF